MPDPILTRRLALPMLMGATLLAGWAQSQDAPAPAADPAKDSGPSEATLKLARQSGMHTQMKDGVTFFCWEDPNIGTRFKTKKCVDETRLVAFLEQRLLLQDQMRKVVCLGAALCGDPGKKISNYKSI